MVLLQETKRSQIDEKFVRSCWYRDKLDFLAVDSVGTAGGLLCIWNPDAFQMLDCCCNQNFIILSSIRFSFDCVIVNIYASNDSTNMRKVWGILTRLKPLYDKPWCLVGDFNEIMNISKRKGCYKRDRGMCDFNDLIDNLEVCDIHMIERKFTLCNSQEGER